MFAYVIETLTKFVRIRNSVETCTCPVGLMFLLHKTPKKFAISSIMNNINSLIRAIVLSSYMILDLPESVSNQVQYLQLIMKAIFFGQLALLFGFNLLKCQATFCRDLHSKLENELRVHLLRCSNQHEQPLFLKYQPLFLK